MILADTSIWVDHFRSPEARLTALMRDDLIVMHPFVMGELAIGNLSDWSKRMAQLRALPSVEAVAHEDWLAFVQVRGLSGTGLGFVDAHLLAAAEANPGLGLWTRDKRLSAAAQSLGREWTEGD